ncbi:MAG: alkaline phosphatase [Eubacteriales bacterium]
MNTKMKMSKKSIITTVVTAVICLALVAGATLLLTVSRAKINGVDIRDYVIVYSTDEPNYNETAAYFVQIQIKEITGVELAVITDNESAHAHEILVGETSRPLSSKLDADTEGFEFAIVADDSGVAIEGDYFVIAGAVYYFIDTYATGRNFSADIPDEPVIATPIVEAPKNYVFLIGDGMGVYQTKIFEYMEIPEGVTTDGEDFFYGYMFPYSGFCATSCLSEGPTDSAAAGTALATGYKTFKGTVGRDGEGNDVMSLTELASSLGMATAVMSTEKITGATPSAFSAHAANRDDTAEIIKSQALLTNTVLKSATDTYIDSTSSLIIDNVLKEISADEDGFFIMYEEAHIDKKSHSHNLESTFKALLRFNQAIGQFMEFAFYNPDTFVIITADHETCGLKPDGDGNLKYTLDYHSEDNVPVFAYGVGAEIFDGLTVENVQIPKTLAKMWGVESFGDPSSPYPALGK